MILSQSFFIHLPNPFPFPFLSFSFSLPFLFLSSSFPFLFLFPIIFLFRPSSLPLFAKAWVAIGPLQTPKFPEPSEDIKF